MTMQHTQLTSLPVGIVVSDTPLVMSKINAPGCIAAIWERQPLASFQTWLDELSPTVLPQARLILHPRAANDAITHLCREAGMQDCPERDMLAGDIAALTHIFSDVASSDYIRVRLHLLDHDQKLTLQDPEKNRRLICVYRGPKLSIGRNASEIVPDVSVSNGVPFIVRENSPNEFQSNTIRCHALPSVGAPATSLVLTLDPVRTGERASDLETITYH